MLPPSGFRQTLHAAAPVSDEAWEKLQTYAACLAEWQQRLNLIAPATVATLWERHILDCWQLLPLAEVSGEGPVLDFGAGAGLPGLILAIGGVGNLHLVEANHRKAAFLRFAAERCGVAVTVHQTRIERFAGQGLPPARLVTGRALAALEALLALALPYSGPGTLLLFPKGKRWQEEVEAARRGYAFDLKTHESVTEPGAMILEIGSLTKR